MTPKPDSRLLPSQDEFDTWAQSPVTRFIAEAWRLAALRQRESWVKLLDSPLVPADLAAKRLELRTREDAYNAFLECDLDDYCGIITGFATPPTRASGGAVKTKRRA